MPQNNYKEFVFCNKCHNYPCHCKKNEVINMYKRPNNYYNTTTNNEQNNCSITKRQITLIQQTLYTTINFVKKDLEGKIINFTKQIVIQTIVTSITVI